MRRRIILLAAWLLTFYIGASLDFYARESSGETTDCACTSARCVVIAILDNPLAASTHPVETATLLWTARWL